MEVWNKFLEIMNMGNYISYIIVLTYGLIIGSFLNVVIYRLPIMMNIEYIGIIKDMTELSDETIKSKMSEKERKEYDNMSNLRKEGFDLAFPQSRCGSCNTNIPIWLNIPVISYLMLKGKCFFCKESYSPRYLIVELLIGFLFCFSFYTFGTTINFLIITTLSTALMASFFIDLEHRILPNEITFSGIFVGIYYNTLENNFIPVEESIAAVIISYFVINGFIKGYEKIRNKGMMMGDGDIKLFVMCSAWLGLNNLMFLIVISCLIGVIQFLFISPFLKGKIKEYQLPFGPSIILTFFGFIYFYKDIQSIINTISI